MAKRRLRRVGVTWVSAMALALVSAAVVGTSASGAPVLHERFVPNPDDDLQFGATTPSGELPAALDTPSGVVRAPEEYRDPRAFAAGPSTYGGTKTPTSVDASFHLDRLTTAPARVPYDEPFRPSLLPFKRLYAFDAVNEDLSLAVRDKSLRVVPVGGDATAGEDAFFGDFAVDLVPSVAVRIPTVGAGARIRSLHTDPSVDLEIARDGADNWFAKGRIGMRVRVVLELSLPRTQLSSRMSEWVWSSFDAPYLRLPASARPAVERVVAALGLGRHLPPGVVLQKLVDHFRGFHESADLPTATDPALLYEEIALSQRGVCRHRAYAFLVTALGLGFPTRLVHNEAHAWVEVRDGNVWHRIDLGGAPSDVVETRPDALVPNHRPPPDPFGWPEGSTSGARLADRSHGGGRTPWPSAQLSSTSPSSPQGAPGNSDAASPGGAVSDTEVKLTLASGEAKRGALIGVRGSASRKGDPCRLARVDLFLTSPSGARPLGSVATDASGRFDGQVTLPSDVPTGAQEILGRVGAGCR